MISEYWIIGTATTGGAGTSGSTTKSRQVITGKVLAVGVVGNGEPPNTVDITIRTANQNRGLPDVPILALTDWAVDLAWYRPRHQAHSSTGAALAATGGEEVFTEQVISDQVEVVVAQANDGDSVDVCLIVEH